ncbi:MAG: phosphatidate cytidylyltransferase [Rhodobacteraceae bacterium]|nr:MAG: phosphatidate cytidylyltransferase [Paracoccaceae bacterium]
MNHAGVGQWGDLGQRLISGGLFAAAGIFAMWLGGHVFHLFVAAICGIMVWEIARMVGAAGAAIPLGLLAGVACLVLVTSPIGYTLPLVFAPALVGIARLDRHRVTYALYSSAVLMAGFGLVHLRDDFGFAWMVWLALIVIASDVLGYFAGRTFGGPKFWPRVSPKKTWSGTLAGWAGAAVIGGYFAWQGIAGGEIVGISVAIAIAGQFGDIAESALKRRMGVKDSSSILPGHGGMFDRFDAMMGAALFLLLVEQIIDFPPVPV